MTYKKTTALDKIHAMKKRVRVIQGGSSAGKTIAILLLFIDKAQTVKGNLASVVSESMPHLKRGAVRDFINIMEGHKYFKEKNWNKTDLIYTFETGSRIEFFSADQPGKVRGPRRNDLFLNEANNISYETYTQLVIRTDGEVYIDYNPVKEFWAHEEIIGKQENSEAIVLTYKDNEALSPVIIQEIESRRHRKGWWRVFGEGQLGEVEGKIYKDWAIIDAIPHEAKLERYGLDFGYSNDPTAIVACYRYNGGYILDEVCYRKEMLNKEIYDLLSNLQAGLVIADSSEPKSIAEMRGYGLNIIGTTKGMDSVSNGIQVVQTQRISLTKQSVNLIKEYRNYLWMVDKDGKILNTPEHEFSHGMDAIRYALSSIEKPFSMTAFNQQNNQFLINESNMELNSTK